MDNTLKARIDAVIQRLRKASSDAIKKLPTTTFFNFSPLELAILHVTRKDELIDRRLELWQAQSFTTQLGRHLQEIAIEVLEHYWGADSQIYRGAEIPKLYPDQSSIAKKERALMMDAIVSRSDAHFIFEMKGGVGKTQNANSESNTRRSFHLWKDQARLDKSLPIVSVLLHLGGGTTRCGKPESDHPDITLYGRDAWNFLSRGQDQMRDLYLYLHKEGQRLNEVLRKELKDTRARLEDQVLPLCDKKGIIQPAALFDLLQPKHPTPHYCEGWLRNPTAAGLQIGSKVCLKQMPADESLLLLLSGRDFDDPGAGIYRGRHAITGQALVELVDGRVIHADPKTVEVADD